MPFTLLISWMIVSVFTEPATVKLLADLSLCSAVGKGWCLIMFTSLRMASARIGGGTFVPVFTWVLLIALSSDRDQRPRTSSTRRGSNAGAIVAPLICGATWPRADDLHCKRS